MAGAELYPGRFSCFSRWHRRRRSSYGLTDIDAVRIDLFGSATIVEYRADGFRSGAGARTLDAVKRFAFAVGFPFVLVERHRNGDIETQQAIWVAFDYADFLPLAVFLTVGNTWPTDGMRRGSIRVPVDAWQFVVEAAETARIGTRVITCAVDGTPSPSDVGWFRNGIMGEGGRRGH